MLVQYVYDSRFISFQCHKVILCVCAENQILEQVGAATACEDLHLNEADTSESLRYLTQSCKKFLVMQV